MKRIPGKNRVPRLRADASDEQVVRWIKKHDVVDRLDAEVSELDADHRDLDQALERALYEENTSQLNMRIPRAMKVVLTRLARRRTTDATTLARIWIAERIARELGR